MKMLAIYQVNLRTVAHLGVMRKALAQASGFSQNGMQVAMFCGDGPAIVQIDFVDGREIQRKVVVTTVASGSFFGPLAGWLQVQGDAWQAATLAYVRYNPMANDELLQLAQLFSHGGCRLFIEMYTLEYRNELDADAARCDQFWQQQLRHHVDAFFTPSQVPADGLFLGRPIYKMANGASPPVVANHPCPPDCRQQFNLVGVGYLARWHGYDRVIAAIQSFTQQYPQLAFHVYIVGEGPGKQQLQALADQSGVAAAVTFTGQLQPAALAELYGRCHLGLGTLGFHRTGVDYAEPLKHREFMFHRLPFIYSVADSFSSAALCGARQVEATDAAIDLVACYQWYCQLDLIGVEDQLYRYACDHFSWQRQTGLILNKIFSGQSRLSTTGDNIRS